MIGKIQLFFEILLMPLSWLPPFCYKLVEHIVYAISILIVVYLISKVVSVFKK